MTNDADTDEPRTIQARTNLRCRRSAADARTRRPEEELAGRNVVMLVVAGRGCRAWWLSGIVPRLRVAKALAAETNELAAPTVLVRSAETRRAFCRRFCCRATFKPLSMRRFMPERMDISSAGTSISGRTSNRANCWPISNRRRSISSYRRRRLTLEQRQANVHLSEITANRLLGPDQAGCRLTAGYRQCSERSCRQEHSGEVRPGECRQAQTAGLLREGLCAVRRCRYRAQHGYRAADRLGSRRRTGALSVSNGGYQQAAGLHQRAADLLAGGHARADGRFDVCRVSRSTFPGQAGADVESRSTLSARTLNVEVDVDNSKGELLPGAYTEVHLKLKDGIRRP